MDLNIGVLSNMKDPTLDQKCSPSIWTAALENELFLMSNNQVLYSDLLEIGEKFGKAEFCVMHDPNQFNKYQIVFLSLQFKSEQIQMWEEANIQQKLMIWEVLDFLKTLEDSNNVQ